VPDRGRPETTIMYGRWFIDSFVIESYAQNTRNTSVFQEVSGVDSVSIRYFQNLLKSRPALWYDIPIESFSTGKIQ